MNDGRPECAHTVMNHLHVILGNLELIEDRLPNDRLVTDARAAASEINKLLRSAWGPGSR